MIKEAYFRGLLKLAAAGAMANAATKPVKPAIDAPIETQYATIKPNYTPEQLRQVQNMRAEYLKRMQQVGGIAEKANTVLKGQAPINVPMPGGGSLDVTLGPEAVKTIDAYKGEAAQLLKGLRRRFGF